MSFVESYWGLREFPFSDYPNPRQFYPAEAHAEALARLQFLLDARRRLGVLLGGSGAGKSLMLRVLANSLERRDAVLVGLRGMASQSWLRGLAEQLGLNLSSTAAATDVWRRVRDRLLTRRWEGRSTAILLDDIDESDRSIGADIRGLLDGLPELDGWLTIIGSARDEGVGRLRNELLSLAELRIELHAWSEEETRGWIAQAIESSGGNAEVFDAESIAVIHRLSEGVPREVNRLAALALTAAAGHRLPHIDAETVASARQELATP